MTRFIVGVDGSRGGEAALRWATRLAVASDAEIVAVNAYERRYSEMPPDMLEQELADREQLLSAEWTRPAVEAGVRVHTEVHERDPRDMIDRACDDAALVVLGRTGNGTEPGVFHLGSVVEHVAHHCPVPLAVIQPHGSERVERIVVGVDGSGESSAAIRWCATHAGRFQADVLAVQVGQTEQQPKGPHDWRVSTEVEIGRWTEPIASAGHEVTPLAIRGLRPAEALVGIAAEGPPSLLVIGTRGTGGFLGLRVGGVAMKVLHRATTDLVLVPPAPRG